MEKTESLGRFVQDARTQGFKVEEGTYGYILFEDDVRRALDHAFATVDYKGQELVFSAVPSSPYKRVGLTRIARRYALRVRSATALSTAEPELGPGTFEYSV